MAMGLTSWLTKALPFVAMVTVEVLLVGLSTMSKAAMSKGMNRYALIFYANVLSTLILFPLSFIVHRKNIPPLTFSLLGKFFFFSLIGITINKNCLYAGIDYGSPTLFSTMKNLTPAFTFLLAVVLRWHPSLFLYALSSFVTENRMEILNLRSSRSQIKIIGTLVLVSGALTATLYKGFPIGSSGDRSSLGCFLQSTNLFPTLLATGRNWVFGGLFCAAASLSLALYIIGQGPMVKEYPAEMTIVACYFLFGTIQSAAVSFVAGIYQPNAWTIRPDIELLTVICAALVGNVIPYLVDIWCIHRKGPVFVAMFKPLGIAIAAIMGVIFLGETLHIGTIIGSIIVITGFYGVMWAKSRETEEQVESKGDFLPSFSQETPLLQSSRHV